ncbi:MAG TPA: hypothetical protein V6C84_05620 [Coleofasciculaceae cyanobacterium]
MMRHLFLGVMIVCLAIATFTAVPVSANAAGFFDFLNQIKGNQSQSSQPSAQTDQSIAREAQEKQYTPQEPYPPQGEYVPQEPYVQQAQSSPQEQSKLSQQQEQFSQADQTSQTPQSYPKQAEYSYSTDQPNSVPEKTSQED